MNNYEKIKNMTIEEMREWLCSLIHCEYCLFQKTAKYNCEKGCDAYIKQWLESEASDDNRD